MALGALVLSPGHVTAQTAWNQVDTNGPARTGHAMAFFPPRGITMLFGGLNGTQQTQETWEWNGSSWLQRGNGGPPARSGHAMCFDPLRSVIVLFGGFSSTTGFLNDTWEWNGAGWAQRNTFPSPPARARHAMAFDGRGVTVSGGENGTGLLTDTESLQPLGPVIAWTQRNQVGPPPARKNHAMVFDPGLNRVIMHGGLGSAAALADTWLFDVNGINVFWTPLTFPTSPVPVLRDHHTMVFDDARRRTIIFGSAGGSDTNEIDTTVTPPTFRQRLGTNPSMFANTGQSMAFDTIRAKAVRLDTDQNTWVYGPVNPATSVPYGTACPFSTTGMPAVAPATPGDLLWLGTTSNVRVATPGGFSTSVFLILGLSNTTSSFGPLPLNLTSLGAPGCTGLASTDSTLGPIVINPAVLFVDFPLVTPNTGSFIGMRVFAQGSVIDLNANALGFVFSNGLDMTIGQK